MAMDGTGEGALALGGGRGDCHSALFLHGGPGLTAAMERHWYQDRLPIYWWDQPAAQRFSELVDAAAAELESFARPVHLVAHSFAGSIARALADACPERISRLTLLSCPFDTALGAVRVCRSAAALRNGELALATDRAERSADPDAFRAMVQAAVADPLFATVYFGPGSQAARERFLEAAPQHFSFDFDTYCFVMAEFVGKSPRVDPSAYRGSVRLVLGRHDVALAPEEDLDRWRRVFPQLSVRWVDTGHFVQFEAEPGLWFGDAREAGQEP
ncbi:putative uncharacterized protein [Burkholderiales bacterium GJ-E10]|nr:putative uncharacterized protein [Burkholderiales bacterium GJ-E10]